MTSYLPETKRYSKDSPVTPPLMQALLCASLLALAGVGVVRAQPIALQTIATGFNNPIGIDHHEATNKVVLSVNYPNGTPRNFELVDVDGSRQPFSALAGLTDEVKIAAARDDGGGMSLGGFIPGEIFTGTGTPGHVARISADGSTVINPWVILPGETGLLRGSLHVDRTGVYAGDLIVVTTAGNVWRVDSSGTPSLVASPGGHLEGTTTVPGDPDKYGPWAGKILVGAEQQGRIYAIDAAGNTEFFTLGIDADDFDIVPASENFFGVDFSGRTLWGAGPDQFAGMVGDILIAQESPGILWHVRWDALTATFITAEIARVAQWEHVTFSTAGIRPIPPISNCNGQVTYQPLAATFATDTGAVGPEAPAGTFSFFARMTNIGTSALEQIATPFNELTNGNLVLNADGGAAGAGGTLTVPLADGYVDGILTRGESVDVLYEIGLTRVSPFRFFVDVVCILRG